MGAPFPYFAGLRPWAYKHDRAGRNVPKRVNHAIKQ
jgi:hypothetical protein